MWSPLLGQAGGRDRTNEEGRQVNALKKSWLTKKDVSATLALIMRVVRLLHHLMETVIGDKAAFQTRTQLVSCVMPAAGATAATFLAVTHMMMR